MSQYILPETSSYQGEWTGLTGPSGLAQAPGANGNVYVAGYRGDLFEVDFPAGNTVQSKTGLNALWQLAVDSAGKLLGASDSGAAVTRYDPASNFAVLTAFTSPDLNLNQPYGVAVDPRTGNVLATNDANRWPGRVVAYSGGTFLREVVTGLPLNTATGLALDAASNMYLALNDVPGSLLKYDSSGRLVGKHGGALMYPWAVAVGADGTVWITEGASGARKITCM